MAVKASFTLLFLLALPLASCMNTPDRSMTQDLTLSPAYVAEQSTKAQSLIETPRWWELYEDEELNALVTHALSNNPNLNQIRARLNQARALSTKSASPFFPTLNVSGDRSTFNGTTAHQSDFDLAGAASYEIDIWGSNRATYKSSSLNEQASLENLYAGAITLSASIVESWLTILSLVEQENLLLEQIENNQTILDLQQKRFEMGSSRALDVLQQQEVLSAAKARLPNILSAQKQAINALILLIGEAPKGSFKISTKPLPGPLAIPNSGIPSDLLQNRPDVIAAWLKLISSDWAAKAAFADRLPSFGISAIYSTSDTKLSGLFDSWLLSLAGNFAAPIFDGNARKAVQLYQEAVADERYHAYRQTILEAVNDVENSLISNGYQDKKVIALENQLSAAHQTLEQAQLSYTNGQSSYINVLSSINSTQALEQTLIAEKLAQAKARISLYRALGGRNWAVKMPSEIEMTEYKSNKESSEPPPENEIEKPQP